MPQRDADHPDARPDARRGAGFWRRWRGTLVLVPAIAALAVAGLIGARMLFADQPSATTVPDVVCWSGTQAPLTACGLPTGATGLRWVFPSIKPHDTRCTTTPVAAHCRYSLKGQSVTVVYGRQPGVAAARSAIRAQLRGITPVPVHAGERLVWKDDSPDADGRVTLVEAYAKYPYTVAVTAPSPAVRDLALARLVAFRQAAYVVARPPAPSATP